MIVEYLTDKMIAIRVPGFGNHRTIFGRSDHLAMLVSDAERTQSRSVFTCIQFAPTAGGPHSAHRSGNLAIPLFHSRSGGQLSNRRIDRGWSSCGRCARQVSTLPVVQQVKVDGVIFK